MLFLFSLFKPSPTVFGNLVRVSELPVTTMVLLTLFKPSALPSKQSLNVYVGTQTACADSSHGVYPQRAADMNLYSQ